MASKHWVWIATKIVFCGVTSAWASDQVGTLTQVQGDVKLFSHPGRVIQGPPPHALFEKEYYSVAPAQIGSRVELGNIVRTSPGSKARVIFDNGDQYNVGSGTAFRVSWDMDAVKTRARINLMHGQLRGIISKGGPRSNLTIRTRSVTMGVRGTDFFIVDGGTDGGTEVSVLRGSVEVRPLAPQFKLANSYQVAAGYSIDVPVVAQAATSAQKEETEAKKIEVRKSTQQDLLVVQAASKIKQELRTTDENTQELSLKIKKLETQAVETTLNDIKNHDPKLYAQIQNNSEKTSDDLNSQSVQTLLKDAPTGGTRHKPFRTDLDNLSPSDYDKYFKESLPQ